MSQNKLMSLRGEAEAITNFGDCAACCEPVKIEIAQPVASPSKSRLLRSSLRDALAMTGEAIAFGLLAMTGEAIAKTAPRNDGLFFNAFVSVIFSFGILFCCCLRPAHAAYDPQGRRDPFMPLVSADGRILKVDTQPSGGLLLEGIIYDENGSSYAIVNSSVVRETEDIGGYTVLKIEKNKVIFSKDSKIKELEISPGDQ